jgi:hypothetical protein
MAARWDAQEGSVSVNAQQMTFSSWTNGQRMLRFSPCFLECVPARLLSRSVYTESAGVYCPDSANMKRAIVYQCTTLLQQLMYCVIASSQTKVQFHSTCHDNS